MVPGGESEPVRLSTVGLLALPGASKVMLPVELVYRPADPLAVTLVLGGAEGEAVRWTFAWDLLAAGLLTPVGEGDVRVAPAPPGSHAVEIRLAGACGVRVRLPNMEVSAFVRALGDRQARDAEEVGSALDVALAVITAGA